MFKRLTLMAFLLLMALSLAPQATKPSYAQGSGTEFVEFQSIPTNGASDWEFFTIGSDHYLAVANYHNDSTHNVDSKLYRWDGTSFVQFQSIPTNGAHDWEFFTIGSDHYLAVANARNGSTYNIDSKLYRWDGTSFVDFQSIPTNYAHDWQFFAIGSDYYLVVANHYKGAHNTDSKIYQWDGTSFVESQSIPTSGASGWEFFTIGSDHYLAVANWSNGSTYNIDSKLYRWDGTSFAPFQSIPTNKATNWDFFTIGSDHYLAVASSTYNIDSKLYRWDGTSFVEFQSIPGAIEWKFFTIGSDHYLALANRGNGSTSNIDSKLYRWDGTSFAPFQSIPTNGAVDWEFFTIGSDNYLAVANSNNDSTRNIDSKIYKAVDKTLLSVHVLAVDNAPESDLSWTVPSAITEIAAATAADANKTALVLVDEPGDGNTAIYEVRNGVATAISGLPDTSGALTTSITEYNTADGATLGGFLLWARNTYTADKVTFSYVGHGGPLVPEADYSQIFGSTLRAAAANGIPALPMRVQSHPAYTDMTPTADFLSLPDMSEALRVGTNDGANPFEVVDLVHCFSSSLEEYHALSPYTKMMTGSPNYAFFAPKMAGQALDGISTGMTAQQMAETMISQYDRILKAHDDPDTPQDDHPHLLVAVQSDQIALISAKWHEIAYHLLQDAEYRTKLVNAYEATGDYYDTTYRSPQDWALASPDGLVDLYSFASQVATQFGEPVNSLVNNELLPLLDTAVTARYAQDGSPWFADTNPKPTWTFGGKGLSLYADLVGTQIDDQLFISWHAPFYANIDNLDPPPYDFMQSGYQGVTWGSLFAQFWQDTNNLQLDAYLPDFPPIPAELSCEDAEIRPGEAITVDIVASGVNVYGIQANCTAEQSIVSGPAVTLGDFFEPSSRSVGMNQIDESTASWSGLISQQNPAPPVSGEAILATLTYTGTTPGSSQITCDPLFSNRDGFAIPAQAAACTITVLAPISNTISSHVEYQGRLDHTAINVTMTHTTSGSSQTSTTDDKGYFESDPLEVGNYQVKADADLYLPACETTDLTSDEPTILPSTALSGGDMNDDDTINIGDATLLGANLDSVAAEADINADGTVNVQDWSILQGNYEKDGCQEW